jgi:hypothetical protein
LHLIYVIMLKRKYYSQFAIKFFMKYIFFPLILIFFITGSSYAQSLHEIHGTVLDTTKLSIPGSSVKLVSDVGDSTITTTDIDGKFNFYNVKGSKIVLTVTSIGFQGIRKRYTLDAADNKPLMLGNIVLNTESKQLNEVTIVGVIPVKIKEDTVDYKISAYPVRENAPVEDVLKKIPGVDVDANGNVTTQGKSITKVRINGKDFMGGDVQAATKNLPADILESVQVIDDYGDQANLTGVRTGEPNKILNFTIRADKNYGYSVQATAGYGSDLLPKVNGVSQNNDRYIGSVNAFNFKGNRQITVLGNINNTNTNTFNFGGGGGGNPGGGGGGGGNRGGGAPRGGGGGLASVKDGITNARAIGTNYRDQWGKFTSVYGSYSYSDNSTLTNTNTIQTNSGQNSISNSDRTANDHPINHRFNFNLEYKPDTINYLKVTPSFSYASTNSNSVENVLYTQGGATTKAYKTTSINTSSAPTFGLTALFNHRFQKRGRNLSLFLNASTAQTNSYDNPINTYTVGVSNVPAYQVINSDNRTTSYGASLSYLEPIGKISYLELNYAYNHSYTSNDKETDTLSNANTFNNYALLSNNYNYTFTTNKIGLNYRVIGVKYNYTLGIGVQPSVLDGRSITTGVNTHVSQVNYVPAARFIYNFSRNESLSFNYNGASSQPSFNQLQPVTDFSNALYLTQGNPNLLQSFNNNFSLRYNTFGIASGNIMFLNASFTQTNDYVASHTITYAKLNSAVIVANPELARYSNTILTKYLNSDGYYTATGMAVFSKPWEERKYTVTVNGAISYTQYPGFVSTVDENNVASAIQKNIAKSLVFTPGARFRLDIANVIDAQALASYSITKTTNSLNNPLVNQNTNIRALTLGLSGKNYFGNWTFSYDYNKQLNYGYATNLAVTNPNILSVYVERRFLAQNRGTIRLATYDLFNQNTGYSTTQSGNSQIQTNTNRLGRYFMATFALRLQKFAGRAPTQEGEFRRGEGGGGRDTRGFGGGNRERGTGGPGGNAPGGGGGNFGGGNGGGGNFGGGGVNPQ